MHRRVHCPYHKTDTGALHSAQPLAALPAPAARAPAPAARPALSSEVSPDICGVFNSESGCKYGPTCKYVHRCRKCGVANHGAAACPQ